MMNILSHIAKRVNNYCQLFLFVLKVIYKRGLNVHMYVGLMGLRREIMGGQGRVWTSYLWGDANGENFWGEANPWGEE